MRPRILLMLVVIWVPLGACGPKKESSSPPQPTSPERPPQVTSPEHLPVQTAFDLGGPCSRQPALDWKLHEEYQRNRNWNALVDFLKQNVRDGCNSPVRWEMLFGALIKGRRFAEAIQVDAEMARLGFPIPHAGLTRAGSEFLKSSEFRSSAAAIEYFRREREIDEALHRAEMSLASMPDSERPPNPYRSEGACPGEWCGYTSTKTHAPIQLRESIESDRIVAELPAGAEIRALTGEARGEPEPYAVLKDGPVWKAGDVIFFLDHTQLREVNYWYKGKRNPDLGILADYGLEDYTEHEDVCNAAVSSPDFCALRKLYPTKKSAFEWWVKVQTPDGRTGWTHNTGQFSIGKNDE